MDKIGYIGKLFVKCELLRLGFEVYSPDNPSQKDWDLIILTTNSNIVKKLKYKLKPSIGRINQKIEILMDILLIMLILILLL